MESLGDILRRAMERSAGPPANEIEYTDDRGVTVKIPLRDFHTLQHEMEQRRQLVQRYRNEFDEAKTQSVERQKGLIATAIRENRRIDAVKLIRNMAVIAGARINDPQPLPMDLRTAKELMDVMYELAWPNGK